MDFAVAQRRDISAIAKVVYAILKCYENEETGRCDPSQVMIADDAGASLGSVKRAIKQLIDARIIDADRVPGSTRNAYRFLDPSVQNDTIPRVQNDTPRVQNDTSMGPKCDLHESILIPPRVKMIPLSYIMMKRTEKNKKRPVQARARLYPMILGIYHHLPSNSRSLARCSIYGTSYIPQLGGS